MVELHMNMAEKHEIILLLLQATAMSNTPRILSWQCIRRLQRSGRFSPQGTARIRMIDSCRPCSYARCPGTLRMHRNASSTTRQSMRVISDQGAAGLAILIRPHKHGLVSDDQSKVTDREFAEHTWSIFTSPHPCAYRGSNIHGVHHTHCPGDGISEASSVSSRPSQPLTPSPMAMCLISPVSDLRQPSFQQTSSTYNGLQASQSEPRHCFGKA